ncbi:hypothetical protein DH2020_038831 [Rehmannia glutinosa]|uniref:Reverse transcriptase zinc-binding domain n=1 Tax=Rehmannia glutinosa TaxID=99300 RepID=A0ABR0UXS7_REHGL
MHATLGSRPSWSWRSILGDRSLIPARCRRLIRSGNSTKLWSDPWIPRSSGFLPRSSPNTLTHSARVSALINQSTCQWDENLVCDIFSPAEAADILAISLPPSPAPDLWCWHHTKNGKHSVRSAYHVMLGSTLSPLQEIANANSSSGIDPVWKTLWKINVPSRIKLFLWKCCTSTIATSDNLARRGIISSGPCPLCLAPENFATHTDALSGVFGSRNYLLPDDAPIELISVICSLIWFYRNRSKFDKIAGPRSVVLTAHCMVKDFQEAFSWPDRPSPLLASHPLLGSNSHGPRIYFDGSISQANRCAGIGVVYMNVKGEFVSGLSKKFPGVSNPEEAEYLALKESMLLARSLDLQNISFYGDAATVIFAACDETTCPAQCLNTYEDIKRLKQSFNIVEFFWIRRTSNTVAHEFAFLAKNMIALERKRDSLPPSLVHSQLDDFQQY